ncbi:MAG: GNAT family N-acetyltransferase [Chroococcidiopsidaceae cyanobacterium CP_BM_ER_R8_30]|nr:GNAT family N-acetyltransferase [Chroococcidiopsidaceae cyanobacterium CP_BM_ER_R8_30]
MQLETQRLILREFQREEFRQLAPILADPQVMKFSPTGVLSVSQTQEKIESFISSYAKYGFGKWAVIFKESDELIGYCGIAVETIDNREEKEIGYRLAPRVWGKGLATEAAAAALQYGFIQFRLPYMLNVVERANTASIRVLEKLGMKYERETVFYKTQMDVYRVDSTT